MPTATNGQTSPTPIPPSRNGSEESRSSLTPAPQQGSATPSAEAPPTGVSTTSPTMPMKPTQPYRAISIPNGYHIQNNYAATMSNRLQWNPSIPSSECAAERTPRTAKPVEECTYQWLTRNDHRSERLAVCVLHLDILSASATGLISTCLWVPSVSTLG